MTGWLDLFSFPLIDTATGKTRGVIEYVRDITPRKQAEEALRASLHEKEILLKEIHHRVKNNMQVISSLLSLQSRHLTDPKAAIEMFQESQHRIRSMALVHEKLYQSKDLSRIDFAKYLENLIMFLFHSYQVDSDRSGCKRRSGMSCSGHQQAIPCGLIINELVTNALKHAFPGGRKGEITVSLQASGDGRFILSVSDNGVGFPAGLDFHKTDTLGMQLVTMLVDQLDGTISIERKPGTRFGSSSGSSSTNRGSEEVSMRLLSRDLAIEKGGHRCPRSRSWWWKTRALSRGTSRTCSGASATRCRHRRQRRKALQKASKSAPDLVLMDIVLKGEIDGITAAEKLWEDYSIPVIYLTAYADDTTVRAGQADQALRLPPQALRGTGAPDNDRNGPLQIQDGDEAQREGAVALHGPQEHRRRDHRHRRQDGLITFMNPLAERLTGWTQDEALEKSLRDVFCLRRSLLRESPSWASRKPAARTDGNMLSSQEGGQIPVEQTSAPIIDRNKRTGGTSSSSETSSCGKWPSGSSTKAMTG